MKTPFFSLAVASAAGFAAFAAPAIAEDAEVVRTAFIEDVGAQERINLSGKLRMLSQRIPSAACHLAEGVDVEGSSKLLRDATFEFEKILNGLEFGDDDLNIIGNEKRGKTLAQIKDLRAKWEPVKAAAAGMIGGDVSEANLNLILDQNMAVLGSAKILVSELVGQYSDPASMLQAHSMLIDISGRQRMLTQKMAKESCMLASAHAKPDTVKHLSGTMEMFETSLMALVYGMPDAGINPPPNFDIEGGLGVVLGNWREVKPVLETLVAGGEISNEVEAAKFQALNTTMVNMNKVVGMYTAAAKMGI